MDPKCHGQKDYFLWRACAQLITTQNWRVSYFHLLWKLLQSDLIELRRNIITLNLMEAVGEAHVFAEKTNLPSSSMEELITESFGMVAGGYSQRLVFLFFPG